MIWTQLYLEPRHKRYLLNRPQADGTTVSEVSRMLISHKMADITHPPGNNSGEWALKLARKAERMGIRGPDLHPHRG